MIHPIFPYGKKERKKKEEKNDTLYSAQSDCATSSGSLRSIAIWMTRGIIQIEGRIVSPLCLANVTISNSVAIKLSRAFGLPVNRDIFWRYFAFSIAPS